jgi:hypothetical protein
MASVPCLLKPTSVFLAVCALHRTLLCPTMLCSVFLRSPYLATVPCVAPYLALCYVLLSLTHCVVQVACTCCHRAYKPDRISAHQQLCQKWQQMQHEDPPEDSQSAPHSVKRAPPTTSSPAEMAQCRCCHKSFKKSMLRHHERACRFHKDRVRANHTTVVFVHIYTRLTW